MDIVFIRHGQTYGNNRGILQGQTVDSKLNDEGRKQIRDTIQDLRKFDFDIILSSPSKRATQSAQIIKESLDIPIKFDKRIMERGYGSLDGKTRKDASKKMGMDEESFVSIQRSGIYDFRKYGGESSNDVQKRTSEFIDNVKKEYGDKKILVVTHGGVIRQMHSLYREEAYTKHESLPNASMHVFDV